MEIITKNDCLDELEIKEILEGLIEKYEIPVFTEDVLIEKGVVPHSHPVLTLGTRTCDPLVILKTFIHEQLHWFEAGHPRLDEAMGYLGIKYKNKGEFDENRSFYIHIIVCFNTRNILKKLVSKEDLEYIYKQWQPYPLMEDFIVENFDEVEGDLRKFEMVYLN